LKLVVGGYRNRSNGVIGLAGSRGYYWSSAVSGSDSYRLIFDSDGASVDGNSRPNGFSVRCIND
jgi:hypothetical protein